MSRKRPKITVADALQYGAKNGARALNLEAPKGAYLVDAFAESAFSSWPIFDVLGDSLSSTTFIRGLVNRAYQACMSSAEAFEGAPDRATLARKYLITIGDVSSRIKRWLSTEREGLAWALEEIRGVTSTPDRRLSENGERKLDRDRASQVVAEVNEIDEMASQLGDRIETFLKKHRVPPAVNSGNGSVLERHFVDCVAALWAVSSGSEPSPSSCGPYVNFLVASWTDLGLPDLGDDPHDVLGRLHAPREKATPIGP